MIYLITLFTLFNFEASKNIEENGGIVYLHRQDIEVHQKLLMNFYQLDEEEVLQLVDKVKMRGKVAIMPVRKLDLNKPVVINYYVKADGDIVSGNCHTLLLNKGEAYELKVKVSESNTSLDLNQISNNTDAGKPKLIKGIHFYHK